jgi:putative PIN family toxin of toxin-antitoxin system
MGQTLRLVLDTNVLLSGIAYSGSVPGKILTAWRLGSLEVVLSDYIIEELSRVLPRLSHRHGLTSAEMDDLVDILTIQAHVLAPEDLEEPSLRDAHDFPILGTLIAAMQLGGIDYLVTGDKDLLALAPRYPIISPADFWARHG